MSRSRSIWGGWGMVLIFLHVPEWSLQAQNVGRVDAKAAIDSNRGPLRAGDLIRLYSWREPELKGEYPVDENGIVILPLVGALKATEVPWPAFKAQVAESFGRQLRNQEVQITLLHRVRVLGAVKNPGIYHVDGTMTLGDVLAVAGGVTEEGKANHTQILRAGKRIATEASLSALVTDEVQSGDQIVVPERSWFSRKGYLVVGSAITAVAILLSRAL